MTRIPSKKLFLLISLISLLSSCRPTPTQTSEVFETLEILPTPTVTPIPPTNTPLPPPTPMVRPTETATSAFEPMEISAEFRPNGDYIRYTEDVLGNGKLLGAEKKALQEGKVVIDPNATNYGWQVINRKGSSINFFGPIYNVTDSEKGEPAYRLVSLGYMDGGIYDIRYQGREFALLGIAINNPNPENDPNKTTSGILHTVVLKENLSWFLDNLQSGKRSLLFYGQATTDDKNFWYIPLFNNLQGGVHKEDLLKELVNQGKNAVITPEMERIIYFSSFK